MHQLHFGRKFYKDLKTGYWISTTCPKIRAHVWVWKYYHGSINKGLHVHHIDGDKSNNDISNLEVLTAKEHVAKHDCPKRKALNLIHIGKIRDSTKEWHGSAEGLEWHKQHGLRTWNQRLPFQIKCKQCGRDSETKTFHQEFCSNSCKSACRRRSGLDNEQRICPICKVTFEVNRYAKTTTCSRKCGSLLRSQKRRGM